MRDGRRLRALCLWLIAATFAVFALFPGIDPAVSALFWNGHRFPVNTDPVIEALRDGLWNLCLLVFGLSVAAFLRAAIRGRDVLSLPIQLWAFFVALFVAGPGVLVNLGLKAHWGRARPFQTELFGGTARFTPPWDWTDQCASNCSFVSGEVSGATALAIVMGLAVWHLRARLPRPVFLVTLATAPVLPVLSALQRVAAGRHFLSDAVLAMLFTALVAILLYPRLMERPATVRALSRWGDWLHRALLGRDRP